MDLTLNLLTKSSNARFTGEKYIVSLIEMTNLLMFAHQTAEYGALKKVADWKGLQGFTQQQAVINRGLHHLKAFVLLIDTIMSQCANTVHESGPCCTRPDVLMFACL